MGEAAALKESPSERKTVTVCIDASKRETHHGGSGFKKLLKRLKAMPMIKVVNNKEDLRLELLKTVDVLVLGAPRDKFSSDELADVKQFLTEGGAIAVLTCEGGETKLGCNVNELLEEYGIAARADCVLRTTYFKYLHPKEVYISHGVLQPELVKKKAEMVKNKGKKPSPFESKGGGLAFVYPHGATLSVQRPARAVLSTGAISYPMNRCACAAWEGLPDKRGSRRPRLVVLGSVEIFADDWLEKEENGLLADLVFKWLGRDPAAASLVSAHHSPADEESKLPNGKAAPKDDIISTLELSGETHYADSLANDAYARVPDVAALASRLRPCLQENEPLPADFTKLFVDTLFGFDTRMIPEVVTMYDHLKVKHEPLSLIPPSFEAPLPPLLPATFPPALREPPNPPLDQFDLDEHFASSRERLAQLTNKCLPSGNVAAVEVDDLDYYVREAGHIVGAVARMKLGAVDAKHVLAFLLKEIARFKMVNPLDDGAANTVDKTRRLGEEMDKDAKNAADLLASTEPMKRRQQLDHLADAKETTLLLDSGMSKQQRPVSRSGKPPRLGFQPNDDGNDEDAKEETKLVDLEAK